MSTRTLLDRLVARAPSGWIRSTGKRSILSIVETGRDALISSLGDARIYRGTDNKGFPPYLLTTAGVYEYDISAANLSCGAITLNIGGTTYTFLADFVKRVFIDVTSGGYDDSLVWLSEPALYSDQNPYSTAVERLVVSKVGVQARPSFGSTAPHVTFPMDPGTTTNLFFAEFYWKAPRLVSEDIPMMVPDDFERAIEDFVVAYFQEVSNGAPSGFLSRFETFWKPKFKTYFERSAKLENNKTMARPM